MSEPFNKTSALPTGYGFNAQQHQINKKRQADFTVEDCLAPFLREIFGDFRAFLQKTLLGTHKQKIMNDWKGAAGYCSRLYSIFYWIKNLFLWFAGSIVAPTNFGPLAIRVDLLFNG